MIGGHTGVFLLDQVAHVVARHHAEAFTKWLWFTILMMIILLGSAGSGIPPNPQGMEKLAELVLNPCSRRYIFDIDILNFCGFTKFMQTLVHCTILLFWY